MRPGLVLQSGSVTGDVELAVRAERAGFDAVFSVEFFHRHGYVPLGAIATATERVRIGTAIANAFTRSPLLHASAAMDLDELSSGRMVLGLGSATKRMNEEWYGVSGDHPAPRMRELVRCLREIFAAAQGGGFRFEGRYWNLSVPMFGRPGAVRTDLPIWVAAVNRGMIAVAGEVADALVGHPIATRRWHREVTLPGLREAEAQAGRPEGACKLAPYVITSIGDDAEQARRDAKAQIGFYLTTELYHSVLDLHDLRDVGQACRAAFRRGDFPAMADAVPEELVDEIAIAGGVDEARDRLADWQDLTGDPLFYPPSVGVRPQRLRANLDAILELFGRPAYGGAPMERKP